MYKYVLSTQAIKCALVNKHYNFTINIIVDKYPTSITNYVYILQKIYRQ